MFLKVKCGFYVGFIFIFISFQVYNKLFWKESRVQHITSEFNIEV